MAEMLAQQAYQPGDIQNAPIPRGAPLVQGLQAFLAARAARKADEAEEGAEEKASQIGSQIAGRLTGREIVPAAPAAPVAPVDAFGLQEVQSAAPAFRADIQRRIQEEKNLSQRNAEEQAQLKAGDIQEVTRQSQYVYDPQDAMRLAMTRGGNAAMRGNPMLATMLARSMETPKEAEYGTTPQFDKEGRAFVVNKAGNVRYLKDIKAPDAAPAAVTPTTIMKNGRKVVVDARTGTEIGLAPTDPPASSSRSRESADGLRREFTTQTSQYRGVADAFQKIKSAALNPSAANDISLIFGFMKALDPTSTVREGEAATAENARGVDEDIRNLYNKVSSGQRLSQAQRQDFLQSAYGLVESQMPNSQQLIDRYTGIASRSDLNPEDVVSDPFASVRIPRLQGDNDPMFKKLKSGDLFIAPNGKIMRKR
jgi:hypothetical protein